jgi:hypothetical protein
VGQKLAERVGRGGKARGHTHALGSCEIISPRLAFLPPTASTSVILRFSNGTTRAVGLKSADMGKLQKLKPGLRHALEEERWTGIALRGSALGLWLWAVNGMNEVGREIR